MSLKELIRGKNGTETKAATANPAKAAIDEPKQDTNLTPIAEIAKIAVATEPSEIKTDKNHKFLIEIITTACEGFPIKPLSIINGLLSAEDEKDLLDGSIPISCLRAHIADWLANGSPHISGKDNDNQPL